MIKFSRVWSMPHPDTFSIRPIRDLLGRVIADSGAKSILDPFARNSKFATVTNDMNPNTKADYHMEAVAFLDMLLAEGRSQEAFDMVLLDPP